MIGKFAFVFLAAFCAIQNAETSTLFHHNTFSIFDTLKEILATIKQAIVDFSAEVQYLLAQLQDGIKNIISQVDIPSIVNKIQEKTTEILAESGIDVSKAQECLESENLAVDSLANEASNGVTACIKNADDVARDLKDKIMNVDDKAKGLVGEITSKIIECIKNMPIEAIKCLTAQLEPAKVKVGGMIDEIKTTVESAKQMVGSATVDLATCVDDVKSMVDNRQQTIISDFKICVSLLPREILVKGLIEDIVQVIVDIRNQISDAITDITSKIPDLLKELDKKMREIISYVGLDEVIEKMQERIEDILEKAGINAEEVEGCMKAEKFAVDVVIRETEEAMKVCIVKADDETRKLKDKAMHLEDAARAMVDDVTHKMKHCMDHLATAAICLKNLAAPIKQEVTTMIEDVKDFLAETRAVTSQVGFDFTVCMIVVQNDMHDKERSILADFKTCIAQNLIEDILKNKQLF